jgi:acetyl esterase/lipase
MSERTWSSMVLLVTVGGLLVPRVGRAGDDADTEKRPTRTFEVRIVSDLTYCEGDNADKAKHQLDLYLPKDQKDFPVVFFVHGGAWVHGDKDYFGVYSSLGKFFARHGIGAVVINYRLSPAVQHPEHIKDVARAFAWTHAHIQDYGGRPDQILVCGHSAGGHLVALLATDERYLKAEGLSFKDIKGVMAISGVYNIPDKLFNSVFGKDPEVHKQASPLCQACAGCPPFLIVYADSDFPGCDETSCAFCKALKDKNVPAEILEVKGRNHISIMLDAVLDDDPCAQALLKFVAAHLKP